MSLQSTNNVSNIILLFVLAGEPLSWNIPDWKEGQVMEKYIKDDDTIWQKGTCNLISQELSCSIFSMEFAHSFTVQVKHGQIEGVHFH